MSVECWDGRCTEDSEGNDREDAPEFGAVDCACVLSRGHAVHVCSGDRWGLVEEGLSEVVWDPGGMLVWGMVAVHLSWRLARSVRPYVAGENVGRVITCA